MTDKTGVYAFVDLPGGDYRLDVAPPWGYGPANPTTPLDLLLNPGADMVLNFGHQRLPRLFMPMIVR